MLDGVSVLMRTDVYQFGTVSSHRALVILPTASTSSSEASVASTKKKGARAAVPASAVRIVVGDDAGAITCVSIARGGAVEVDYRASSAGGARIDSVTLGGKADVRERIFYAAGGSVAALTRKGKEFFSMASSTVEPLRALAHDGTRLAGAGGVSFTLVGPEGNEELALTLPDRATALTLARPPAASEGVVAPGEVLIGCADGIVRLVGASGTITELSVEGIVTSLIGWANAPYRITTTDKLSSMTRRYFIYGTNNGYIGIISLKNEKMEKLFSFLSTSTNSGVASLCCVPILSQDASTSGSWAFAQGDGSGTGDIAVAHDDGAVEIYSLESENGGGGGGVAGDTDSSTSSIFKAFGDTFGSSSSRSSSRVGGNGIDTNHQNDGMPLRALLKARGMLPETPRALGAVPSVNGGLGCDIIALCFSGRLSLLRSTIRDDKEAAGDRKAQLEALLAETEVLKAALVLRTNENTNKAAIAQQVGHHHASAADIPEINQSSYFPMAHRLEASHSWTLDNGDVAYTVSF